MGTAETGEPVNDRVEVRVLGPLRVRRADGELVDPREWRTGHTADLLRLLALHVDDPVPVDTLLEALWPTVDEKRGRASLRTAKSGIRKALGTDCIERRLGGLVLCNAWVDAHAFQTLAREARRHVVTGAAAKVVTAAREAEALYLAGLRWQTSNAGWARTELDALAAMHRQLIADAADAAVSLSWWHDALDFAERSVLIEPCSERGYRCLMRAYRGLGETSRALQTYERCRRTLAEELGADPSPETHALHLQLLTEDRVDPPAASFCGRAHELAWMREVAVDVGVGPVVVCVVGAEGSGKSRLLEEAFAGAAPAVPFISVSDAEAPSAALARALAGGGSRAARARPAPGQGGSVVAVLDDAHLLSSHDVDALLELVGRLPAQAVIVMAGRPSASGGPMEQLVEGLGAGAGGTARLLHLPSLPEEEVAALCAALLHGAVSRDLTQSVLEETGGVPGAVIDLVCRWAVSGRVASTTDGLALVEAHRPSQLVGQVRRLLAEAVDRLSGPELEVLHLVAVLGKPVAPDALLPLTLDDHARGAVDVRRR